ncbi:unnamed protein product [Didymodactylos carnosus]|uniref:Uncharacterized protein n=1 Tax=Didymodactylos carnosus TaxID=1234261 RepID=A0A815IIV3_9BILA|nr:unnamed protein product [Didymodactylos carnosus]CAF4253528.1 unnamed protein product [Didymodactylos carnosus]
MINETGFHKDTVDIFTSDVDHSMNSARFIEWIGFAASHLRLYHGLTARIAIIIDNAAWHNELTEESKPPKRSWRKEQIQQWLTEHKVTFDPKLTKAELLETAFHHVPPKQYKTNVAAMEYDVEIVRLPIKYCVLNLIELAWAQLKGYVRTNNTLFRLTDIHSLSQEYMAAVDEDTSVRFIEHAQKAEETFRKADNFMEEEMEPNLVDDDDEDIDPDVYLDSTDDDDGC